MSRTRHLVSCMELFFLHELVLLLLLLPLGAGADVTPLWLWLIGISWPVKPCRKNPGWTRPSSGRAPGNLAFLAVSKRYPEAQSTGGSNSRPERTNNKRDRTTAKPIRLQKHNFATSTIDHRLRRTSAGSFPCRRSRGVGNGGCAKRGPAILRGSTERSVKEVWR